MKITFEPLPLSSGLVSKYDELAGRWSDTYASSELVYRRRAQLVRALGRPSLVPGDRVLELGCADGGLAEHLLELGLIVEAVDVSPAMIARARARLGSRAQLAVADLREYQPSAPVAATIGFRVLPYAGELTPFFRDLGRWTERKLVFDLVPSTGPSLQTVERSLRAAGFDRIARRCWLLPARTRVPPPLRPLVFALERVTPLAQAIVRHRFSVVVAAWRT